MVETADAETRVVAPEGLQAAIDAEVVKVASGGGPHPAAGMSCRLAGGHVAPPGQRSEGHVT